LPEVPLTRQELTMCAITMEIPDRSLAASQIPVESAADELRMLAAVKLYELGRLSSGAAAEFAGIPKPVFLQRLGAYGVATFRQTEEELREEIANA
jgi:predicted HTH domain antitoxin